jgi:hypothetical protein
MSLTQCLCSGKPNPIKGILYICCTLKDVPHLLEQHRNNKQLVCCVEELPCLQLHCKMCTKKNRAGVIPNVSVVLLMMFSIIQITQCKMTDWSEVAVV